ncbi:MAG: hypothetical protein ACLFPJ_06255 [Candidatus Woesearchaeota archaeon]
MKKDIGIRYVIRYLDKNGVYNYMKSKNSYATDFYDANFTYSLYYKCVIKYKTLKRAFDKLNKIQIDNLNQFEVVEFDLHEKYISKLTSKIYKYRDLSLYFKINKLMK